MLNVRRFSSMVMTFSFAILMMMNGNHHIVVDAFAARNQPKHSAALVNTKRSHLPQLPRKNKAVWWADAPHQGVGAGDGGGIGSPGRGAGPAGAGRGSTKSNKQDDVDDRTRGRQWTFGRVPRF